MWLACVIVYATRILSKVVTRCLVCAKPNQFLKALGVFSVTLFLTSITRSGAHYGGDKSPNNWRTLRKNRAIHEFFKLIA